MTAASLTEEQLQPFTVTPENHNRTEFWFHSTSTLTIDVLHKVINQDWPGLTFIIVAHVLLIHLQ